MATIVTDETSNSRTYCPDALGRLSALTEPGGTVTNYVYDILDNLTGVVTPNQTNAACPTVTIGTTPTTPTPNTAA